MLPVGSLALLMLGATAVTALLALVAVMARKGKTEDEARAYLAGFTYVLSDDPDAAIAELSRAAQLNTQTLETYFALGALFRRQGELERAIRLHRNILLRPGLSPEVRERAQLALARDYRRSGLKDKAQETLEKLLAEQPEAREAVVELRQLHEEAGRWAAAVELQSWLVRREGTGHEILSHLLAAASRERVRDAPGEAQELAARAAALCPGSADAQLALGEAWLAQGERREAAPALLAAVGLEPELAPRTVPLLRAVLPAEEVARFFEERTAQAAERGAPCALARALLARQEGKPDEAIAQLKQLVRRAPRLWEARKELGALLLAQDRRDEVRAEYAGILSTLGQPLLGFACTACRQKVPEHLFRCPGCGSWGSVRRELASDHEFDRPGGGA